MDIYGLFEGEKKLLKGTLQRYIKCTIFLQLKPGFYLLIPFSLRFCSDSKMVKQAQKSRSSQAMPHSGSDWQY